MPPVLVNTAYSRERATPHVASKRRRHSGSGTTSVDLARFDRSVRWTTSRSAAVPTGFEPADRWEQIRSVSVSRRGRDLAHVDRNGPLCHGTATCGNTRTPAATQGRDTVCCGRILIREAGDLCHGSTEVVPEPPLVYKATHARGLHHQGARDCVRTTGGEVAPRRLEGRQGAATRSSLGGGVSSGPPDNAPARCCPAWAG